MIVHKMVDIGGDASCHICVQNEQTEKHPSPPTCHIYNDCHGSL